MKSEEAKRLKELEGENARLKRLLAEAELDKAMLKERALRETTEPDPEAADGSPSAKQVFCF
jgi:septal ring factor EnvC (AmiA/AmiB activator)